MSSARPSIAVTEEQALFFRARRTHLAAGVGEWPVRLLPQWDTHTGVNAPTVVARGRFVATWSHKATRKSVSVKASPLSRWRGSYRGQVEREARDLAAHLGVPDFAVEIE